MVGVNGTKTRAHVINLLGYIFKPHLQVIFGKIFHTFKQLVARRQ